MDSLSGIQRYMLLVETNKLAAQETVTDIAQSMKTSHVYVTQNVELTGT